MSFEREWSSFYGDGPPIAWMLRRLEPQRWQRFHSLPDSKRYAEGEAEVQVVLGRANVLAAAVLGDGSDCWIAQGVRSDAAAPEWLLPNLHETPLRFDDPDEPGLPWRIFAAQVAWRRGAYDELLTSIANDLASEILWVSRASGAVFAPYDGGVDLFVPTQEQRAFLRKRHADWLSAHPSGL